MQTTNMTRTSKPLRVLSEILHALIQKGYRPGVPANLSSWAAAVDAGVCGEMTCSNCGRVGMEMHAFHLPEDGETTYRVIAACPVCCTAEEV